MFRKIKDLDLSEFMNMLDEVSKELDKGINVEKEKENKYSKDYNVYEENGLKHYEFMLPGFKKDNIRVELNDQNEIVITTSKLKSTRQYLEKNVPSTKMFKVQIQPELINEDIKTKFEDSILTLSFKQQNNPKILKIN